VIDKGAFIGAGVMILKGVHIGEKSVVAAGSVVTKDIPPNELWGGATSEFHSYNRIDLSLRRHLCILCEGGVA